MTTIADVLSGRAVTFWRHVHKTSTCWLWTGPRLKSGYGQFRFSGRNWRAHRLVWAFTHGDAPQDALVCHHGDTPLCVRPDHLVLGTPQDNVDDMRRKGRMRHAKGDASASRLHPESRPRGDAVWSAILTAPIVLEARTRVRNGEAIASLAREFGVTHRTMSYAVRGVSWRHI